LKTFFRFSALWIYARASSSFPMAFAISAI
jgi:hypothetical protein